MSINLLRYRFTPFLLCLATCLCICLCSEAGAQTSASTAGPATLPRLQAELLKTIDAGHAKAGGEVTARTVTELDLAGTKLAPGAVVKGHITDAAPDHLSVVFDSIVVKKKAAVPLGLSLRAVMMPHAQSTPISPRAEGGGDDSPIAHAPRTGGMLRSPTAAVEDSNDSVFRGPNAQAEPAPVKTINGGVIGLDDVQLQVSDNPKAGATFRAIRKQKLQLEKGLQLMFVVTPPA